MGVRSTLWSSRSAAKSPAVSWPSRHQDRVRRSGFDVTRPSSGMLRRHRRFFAVAAFLLLATPLVVGLVYPDSAASILKEGRNPAPAPKSPDSPRDWLTLPRQVDAYLKDSFGLREKMIRLHKDLTKPLLFEDSHVAVTGRSGRMYAVADDMLAQSAGRAFRPEKVADTVAMIVGMRDALARRGVKFLVALPPNSSTIYQDDLPHWARNAGRTTEYDLLLKGLAARDVRTVDLRPALAQARALGPTYLMNDLHWNASGAIAGFNALVEADGHPDWKIDPSSAIGPLRERKGGDIATLAGVADKVVEMEPSLLLTAVGRDETLSHGPEGRIEGARDMTDHAIVSGRPGPTIMVIGDSFTVGYFPLFLSQHVGRAVWFHHNYCGFDWAWIDKIRPDEVWWTPVERLLVCRPGQKPKNFPEGEARGNAVNEN
jgi:alginate O-acetyltransferase complex protein AlgJ